MEFDPIKVEVWRHLFASIAEEMGATLERTGYSPNIKERRDHSCAIFDSEGRLLAQAAHIPVHLGAMPLMMDRLRETVRWTPGVMWLCNDPAHGGTHLPDLTLVAPVFGNNGVMESWSNEPATPTLHHSNTPIGFVANRAHHADIGGIAPGSLPLSTELFHEGIILPPVRLVSGSRTNQDVLDIVCANSRTPNERRGDLAAQIASNRTGIRRFQQLARQHGLDEFTLRAEESREYASMVVRQTLARAPDGDYSFTDYLDDDGHGNLDIPIRVTIRLREGRISFDFTGTAPETTGSVNATEAVTRSACYYVVRCLVDEEIPMNSGAFEQIEVNAPLGSLVNAHSQRAVAAGNVETSQRIVDVILAALAPAFPDRIPAQSQGTMNNVTIGGHDPFRNQSYAYYETICGGAGAGPAGNGASAMHVHMTNTRNTPIEALEMHYPLRVREYAIRENSGGSGTNRGGDGVIRSVELLAPAQVSLITERRRRAPGEGTTGAALPGKNSLTPLDESQSELAGKASLHCQSGAVISIETPGGAGWSPPE